MFRCREILLLAVLLAPEVSGQPRYPEYPGERLAVGRSIWLSTCEGCHALGIAGAPIATDAEAWGERIVQGREVLYTHAVEGFFGPGGTMMPPRGGNDSLSDNEVRAAVDYMVLLATGTDIQQSTEE